MPVVVTGADQHLGGAVVRALAGQGLDLRATVDRREVVPDLVALGVRTAVSDLVDTERLGGVLEAAHTVLHLRGPGALDVLAGVDDVLAAAEDSGVERLVTLAPLGVAHPALGVLADSGYDVVVLRVGVVVVPGGDPPQVWPLRRPVAPLHVDDLVAALVAADRLRDLHGYVEVDAVGPDVMTAADLDRLLGVRRGWLARWRGGPATDLVGDRGAGLAAVLGVRPRRLAEALG